MFKQEDFQWNYFCFHLNCCYCISGCLVVWYCHEQPNPKLCGAAGQHGLCCIQCSLIGCWGDGFPFTPRKTPIVSMGFLGLCELYSWWKLRKACIGLLNPGKDEEASADPTSFLGMNHAHSIFSCTKHLYPPPKPLPATLSPRAAQHCLLRPVLLSNAGWHTLLDQCCRLKNVRMAELFCCRPLGIPNWTKNIVQWRQ